MIIDKRKSVIENFKEEFSVNGAIETLEGIGYKVYKEIPVDEAKVIVESKYKVLTEEELKAVEAKAEITPERAVEALKETHLVIPNDKIEQVEAEMKEKLLAGKTVLDESEIALVEAEMKERILKEELDGKTVLDESEIALVDEELQKIIAEKVAEKLEELGACDGDEKEDEDGDLLDTEEETEEVEESKTEKPSGKKTLLAESLLGEFAKNESTAPGDDSVQDEITKADDVDGDGDADNSEVSDKKDESATEQPKRSKLLESLV